MHILVNYTGRTGGYTGGGADYAYRMTKALINVGMDVSAIISKYVDNLTEWQGLPLKNLVLLETYTNKVNFVPKTVLLLINDKKKIHKILSGNKYDCIYVPMLTYWSYFINDMFSNTPVVLTLHDPKVHSGETWINKFLFMSGNRISLANKIVILSDEFRTFVKERYKKKDKDVLTIPLTPFEIENSNNEIIEYHYDENKTNFLFYGRIEDYKGLDILSEAYKIVSEKFSEVSLTIAGKGDFSKYASMYGCLPNVTIINRWIEPAEVRGLFESGKSIVVLPYKDATQSGIIGLAMLNHNLVIATNTGGIPEQVQHRKTGLLAFPNDALDFAQKMMWAIENESICDQYINNAYMQMKLMTWEASANKLKCFMENEE